MSKSLDFTVDKENNSVRISREFDAELPLVWDAFTNAEILDQWWAPKPYASRTKKMDFKVGGRRFYAMVSPEGQEHWGTQDYTAITPKTNVKWTSGFADAEENINPDMPSSNWDLNFIDEGEKTRLNIVIKHKTLADIEKLIQMGFKEGFTMTLNYLEQMLAGKS